jgi:hypothetical protein
MISDSLQARVVKDFSWGELGLYLRDVTDINGVRRVAWPINKLEFKVEEPAEMGVSHSPVAYLGATAAQVLMDDLWNCGVRPAEGTGSAGSMAAQGRHLEDLRTLVARSYGVELK